MMPSNSGTLNFLQRIDPRVRLWLVMASIVVCIASSRLVVFGLVLFAAHVILLMYKIPVRQLYSIWRTLAILLVAIMIGQSLIEPPGGTVLLRIGTFQITQNSALGGLGYALRFAAVAFSMLALTFTTPINTLVRGLQKIGLPHQWGVVVGLALRYMNHLGTLYQEIREAQQTRGWDVQQGNIVEQARSVIPTLVALIIASLRLADSLALSMAARGLGISRIRTWRSDIQMTIIDWLIGWGGTGILAVLYMVG